jgi:hypothetical protein
VRRSAMEIVLAGTEIHVLRETLEDVIGRLVKEIEVTEDPAARDALRERERAFRSILDKLPAGARKRGVGGGWTA